MVLLIFCQNFAIMCKDLSITANRTFTLRNFYCTFSSSKFFT